MSSEEPGRAEEATPPNLSRNWSVADLRHELARFERELRAAGLKENSIRTYVDRSDVFVRWLAGEYIPGQR